MKKILIVDDEPDVLHSLQSSLERHHEKELKVAVAGDGEEALKKVESDAPDMIILDLMMPKMGGEELLPILRKNLKTANIPIIVSTVRRETSSLVNLMELGATDYLMKPYEVEDLLRVVKTYLL